MEQPAVLYFLKSADGGTSEYVKCEIVDTKKKPPKRAEVAYLCDSYGASLPPELHGCRVKHRWQLNRAIKRGCVPIVVFCAERCNKQREKIFAWLARTKIPNILLFDGGGGKGNQLCDLGLYFSCHVSYKTVIFSWGHKMSKAQRAAFLELLSNWPLDDPLSYLEDKTEIFAYSKDFSKKTF